MPRLQPSLRSSRQFPFAMSLATCAYDLSTILASADTYGPFCHHLVVLVERGVMWWNFTNSSWVGQHRSPVVFRGWDFASTMLAWPLLTWMILCGLRKHGFRCVHSCWWDREIQNWWPDVVFNLLVIANVVSCRSLRIKFSICGSALRNICIVFQFPLGMLVDLVWFPGRHESQRWTPASTRRIA